MSAPADSGQPSWRRSPRMGWRARCEQPPCPTASCRMASRLRSSPNTASTLKGWSSGSRTCWWKRRREPDSKLSPRAVGGEAGSEGLPAREALADAVPVRHAILPQLPAQLDQFPVAVGEEVHQPGAGILELNSQLLQATERRNQIVLGSAECRGALFEAISIQ